MLTDTRLNCYISSTWVVLGVCTFKAHVSQVQDGSQELVDLPGVVLGEGEDLHGRAEVGVLFYVVPPITGRAFALPSQHNISSQCAHYTGLYLFITRLGSISSILHQM